MTREVPVQSLLIASQSPTETVNLFLVAVVWRVMLVYRLLMLAAHPTCFSYGFVSIINSNAVEVSQLTAAAILGFSALVDF